MRQFSNVLCVIEEDDPRTGLERAIALTKRNGGVLTLVSIIETMISAASAGRFHDELSEAFDALRTKRLSHLKELAANVPDDIKTVCEVMDGRAYMEVIKRVQLYDHDLVVAHAREFGGPLKRLFVSEEMQLLRKCPCPLLLVKRSQTKPFERVFAAIDFDRDDDEASVKVKAGLNAKIVDMAATIADQDGSRLDIVNVFTVPGEGAMVAGWIPMTPENLSDYSQTCRAEAEKHLEAAVADGGKRLDLPIFDTDRITTHVVKGRARVEIPEMVQGMQSDLIVMGTVGRVGVPGFLIGNTAETILGSIDCSVLALKPDGFESTVTVDR
ncbi:universal stress protein [uncultured Algimonas sp.]|uniref:universal stress protein n=1 Tax=uncultured Algimonas sp. TaxID=1547920 RepID=UPI0026210893|nr:universal stress protein [uncultured Algimonas sp.]